MRKIKQTKELRKPNAKANTTSKKFKASNKKH
ncbi:hypothetical protein N207_08410 [Helicobacter pylori UM114]|uniref:Uncharacterized protein n=1 Tax=Helicobacter pylori UM114 TaxID=1355531 RepID=T0G5Q6_HELPX|nr:hypothetical protein N207_08410 [Helicobacter pylori UM114]